MNSSKIFLTILLIIIGCVCSCNKEVSVNQKLEFRGIRLGMSFEELKSKYPKFTEEANPTRSISVKSESGETSLKLDVSKLGEKFLKLDVKDVPELQGLKGVYVDLLDEKVHIATFKYNEEFSKFKPEELTERFEESLGLKNMSCEPRRAGDDSTEQPHESGIWMFIKTRTYYGREIKTFCNPYLITIYTEEGSDLLKLKDEDQNLVLRRREQEIINMDKINKAKPTPQKTFQP
jgi:hypothetical protein